MDIIKDKNLKGQKRHILLFTIFIVLIISNFSCIQASSRTELADGLPTDEKLVFSRLKEASRSDLQIDGFSNNEKINPSNIVETFSFNFESEKVSCSSLSNNKIGLKIKGLDNELKFSCPIIPIKNIKIKLPKNSELKDIQIDNMFYREISNIDKEIKISPKPYFWMKNELKDFNLEEFENKDRYDKRDFYPGHVLSYQQGKDKENLNLIIRLYPIQYQELDKEFVFIEKGDINIHYDLKNYQNIRSPYDYENLIITTPDFYESAYDLKSFHDSEGTATRIVNTTWIYNEYIEAEDPPYDGYSDPDLPFWDIINNYNYSLAKKIITFLRDDNQITNIEFITIFGNARLVPPSYYRYCGGWIPTDFFYSSPEYDLVPNFYIGRLPFNNSSEAQHMVNKIKNWNGTTELFENITIAGGKPFGIPYDIGELTCIDPVNRGYFQGSDITKFFKTDSKHIKENILAAHEGNSGIIYHITHGCGNGTLLDDDSLYIEEIMDLPPSNKTPIEVSIACVNGMYDTNLVNYGFNVSYGEGILLSDAGGIAFIGGSRPNAGIPILSIDKGYISIEKEAYMAGMLTYVFQAYHNGYAHLGELTFNAMSTYLEKNDISDDYNNLTYFEFILLGDPAMKLPSRPTGIQNVQPISNIEKPLAYLKTDDIYDMEIPSEWGNKQGAGYIPLVEINESFNTILLTNSSNLTVKITEEIQYDNLFESSKTFSVNESQLLCNIKLKNSSIYRITSIDDEGKEGWHYVVSSRFVDDDYNTSTPGFNKTKFNKIQDCVDISNEGDIIYVFNGTYCENIMIDKDLYLIGENNHNTIVDGGETGDVITLPKEISYSQVNGFTIKNSGSTGSDVGINLKGYYNKIYNNIITSNNIGIYGSIYSNYNFLYHNNFIDNDLNAKEDGSNCWYNPFFDGTYHGNYWDDYDGEDKFHGINQDMPGSDGIGDTPYNITGISTKRDFFPLMNPWMISNNPPMIYSEPKKKANIGELYSYNVESYDMDNDDLLYELVESPDNMTINHSTGLIEWIPTKENTGAPWNPGTGKPPAVISSGGVSGGPTGNNMQQNPQNPSSGQTQPYYPEIPVSVNVSDPYGGFDMQNWIITIYP